MGRQDPLLCFQVRIQDAPLYSRVAQAAVSISLGLGWGPIQRRAYPYKKVSVRDHFVCGVASFASQTPAFPPPFRFLPFPPLALPPSTPLLLLLPPPPSPGR